MKKVIKIDELGMFVEDVILEDGAELPSDCIDEIAPEGFYLPRWLEGTWVEGRTPEEIEAICAIAANCPKTDKERIIELQEQTTQMQDVINMLLGL